MRGVIFIITRPDKTFLLQLRDGNSKKFPWTWCFPGGASENNENPIETVIREVKEEYDIALDIENIKYLTQTPGKNNNVYICNVEQDCKPKLQEGADMKWVTIEELENIELGFNQKPLVELIINIL